MNLRSSLAFFSCKIFLKNYFFINKNLISYKKIKNYLFFLFSKFLNKLLSENFLLRQINKKIDNISELIY